MVKRWLTPQLWQTWISPRIFLKIHHVYGQKMIDPTRYGRSGSHLEFFLKVQHVHGQKMIDPQVWQTRISPRIFLKYSTCAWSKDDWPPGIRDQDVN